MSNDRHTPKEIKAWCEKELTKKYIEVGILNMDDIIKLMYKAYKRAQMDERSG